MSKSLNEYGGWALVTGASAGIGEAVAREMAAAGVNCVLVARRAERLEALAAELRDRHGVETRCVAADLATRDGVDDAVAAVSDLPIGILVNNAGFGDGGEFHTKEPDRIAEMIALNCQAVALLARAFLPAMIERNNGAVITVASTLGLVGCPYEATYGATKAFDLSFSEALSGELRGTGVTTLCVCPALTRTELLEVQGFSPEHVNKIYQNADSPEKIARMACRALGRKATVGPRDFMLVSFLARILPRTTLAHLIGGGLKRMVLKVIGEPT